MRFFLAQPLGYSIQTAEIDNDAVTAAKIAQGTAGQLLMSDATPDTNWKTMSGDATIDGNGALTIGNDKIDSQHYAAASIDNEHIADDAVGLAEMAAGTAGNILIYDANGNPAAAATGTAGQVLTSNGAGAAPTMQAAAGGGSVANLIVWNVGDPFVVVQGTYTITINATFLNAAWWGTAGDAQNDEFTFNAHLKSGTYTIGIISRKGTNLGILHVSVAGTEETTLDMYAGSETENARTESTGVAVAGDGNVTIALKVASKNASSSGYGMRLIKFYMHRTGA